MTPEHRALDPFGSGRYNTTVPLSDFLDEQLARAREIENIESDDTNESDDEEPLAIPKGYE